MSNSQLAVSLPDDLIKQLRVLAAHHGTSAGIIARAFVAYGLATSDSPEVIESITDEITRLRIRKSEIGRQVMASRMASRSITKEDLS